MEQLNKVKNKTVVRNSQTELIEEKFCLTKLITCYDEVAGLGDADRTMNIVWFTFSKDFNTVNPWDSQGEVEEG